MDATCSACVGDHYVPLGSSNVSAWVPGKSKSCVPDWQRVQVSYNSNLHYSSPLKVSVLGFICFCGFFYGALTLKLKLCLFSASQHSWVFLHFWKWNRNWGCRFLYNCLPKTSGRLLYNHLHQLSGADKVSGESCQLVTANFLWRRWFDTLWVTFIRLWPHSFLVILDLVLLDLTQWLPSKCYFEVFSSMPLIGIVAHVFLVNIRVLLE
jgi:hypothetical protein